MVLFCAWSILVKLLRQKGKVGTFPHLSRLCSRLTGLYSTQYVGRWIHLAQSPVEFTVAPSDAVPVALKNAGISLGDVDFHEINEAFSVVALANMQVSARQQKLCESSAWMGCATE